MSEWNKLIDRVVRLQSVINPFGVEFVERDAFKRFCDGLPHNLSDYSNICITGYFSETVRNAIETLAKWEKHVKLICPAFQTRTKRDSLNIGALKKLGRSGVGIKFNPRLHARLLVAHTEDSKYGLLLMGSFDFNTECIGLERYDAGIKTKHPDLVKSAVTFFDKVWQDSESVALEEFLASRK